MGLNLIPTSPELLSFHSLDVSIADVTMGCMSVDVSMHSGILMLIEGKPSSNIFMNPAFPSLDVSIAF